MKNKEVIMRNLEEYFRDNLKEEIIDFSLRVVQGSKGIRFYIHPDNRNGDTVDFVVDGNKLITIFDTKES